jgi:hypothetical protein
MRFFEWYAQHPDYQRVFDEAMTAVSGLVIPLLVAAYRFSDVGSLVDVAGGQGSLLAAILRASPAVRGTLFDQPEVIESARAAGTSTHPTSRAAASSSPAISSSRSPLVTTPT